jgi:two-component system NtrC family sensor kinase
VLLKPIDPQELEQCVRSALDMHALLDGNARLSEAIAARNRLLSQLSGELEETIQRRSEMLSRAKREWERTFDAIERPIAIVGKDRTVSRANLAYAAQGDREIRRVPGSKCHEVLFKRDTPCPNCPLDASLISGQMATSEIETPDGRAFSVHVFPGEELLSNQLVCTYLEITQERAQQRQLIQAEKLAALGRLAGGLAHEINNPLAAILSFSQLLKADGNHSDEDLEALNFIESNALRCKRIIQSMLHFSRQPAFAHEEGDLTASVREALLLFAVLMKTFPRAHLRTELATGLPNVLFDSNQVQQVILNLLTNAMHALKGGDGTITVRTYATETQVIAEVSDDGSGIKPEHLARIFEPTFTTKAAGSGTGFGLSIAQQIIATHRGQIEVDSTVGKGTTFRIRLPFATEALEASKASINLGAALAS